MKSIRNTGHLRHLYLPRFFSKGQSKYATNPDEETMYSSNKKTHFGFQTISEEHKAKRVKEVFENVAARYDLMNDCMSAGVHRIWKDIFIHRLRPKQRTKLIDVAGGTGDIAFRFLKHKTIRPVALRGPKIFPMQEFPSADHVPEGEAEAQYQAQEETKMNETNKSSSYNYSKNEDSEDSRSVLVCDINAKMIDVGKTRSTTMLNPSEQNRIDWLEADAENMHAVPSNTYDVYTIAFGIRNCVHIDRVLAEAYRVLRPGGRFMCLEFSHIPNSALQWAYDQYSFQVIPVMGQVIAGDWNSYEYLVQSIRKFPNQEKFRRMIQQAGFRFTTYENLTFGVAAIHSGIKMM